MQPNTVLHPCHVPVAIGIQRATDASLMHLTCFQRAPLSCTKRSSQQVLSFIRNHFSVIVLKYRVLHPNVASQRLPAPKERPTGPLAHSTLYPSTLCHLHPNFLSQEPTHPPVMSQQLVTPKERLGRLLHSASRPSDRLQSTSQRRIPATITHTRALSLPAATSIQRATDVPLDPSAWSWSLES
jgi:hypothetical protein